MTVIGADTSERLDLIPAQFRVIVTKRPKLACRACAGTVVQAPAGLLRPGQGEGAHRDGNPAAHCRAL
jgi:transposase